MSKLTWKRAHGVTGQSNEGQSRFKFFLAVLALCCCAQSFSRCQEQELLSSCSKRASHRGGFSCCGAQALGQTDLGSHGSWALERRLSSCSAWTWLSLSL